MPLPVPSEVPAVSVVVPLLDEMGSVETLVTGIRAAPEKVCPQEIILVDDGSQDGTRAVCLRLANAFHAVLVIGHATMAVQSAAIQPAHASDR